MSIVLNVVTQNASWIMSDGLVIDENRKKVKGNFQKYTIIHDHLIIGYTGTTEVATTIIERTKDHFKNIEPTVEECFNFIEPLATCFRDRGYTIQVLVTGISETGNYATFSVNKDGEVSHYFPSKKEYSTSVLLPDLDISEKDEPDLTKYMLEKATHESDMDALVRKSMNHMLVDVSKISDSVNLKVFYHKITLQNDQKVLHV